MFQSVIMMILPLSMIILSIFYRHKAKGPISSRSGFRTALSKSSSGNWRFAHLYSSKWLMGMGILLLILSWFFATKTKMTEFAFALYVFLQLAIFIAIGMLTQYKLKRRNR